MTYEFQKPLFTLCTHLNQPWPDWSRRSRDLRISKTFVFARLGRGHPAAFRHYRHHAVLLVAGYLAETQGDLLAAKGAFEEIWQQDQDQSHYSAAALIGLGWMALKREGGQPLVIILPPRCRSSCNWKPHPRRSKRWPALTIYSGRRVTWSKH